MRSISSLSILPPTLWSFSESTSRRTITPDPLLICLRCWALNVGRWTFSVALATIPSPTFRPIFAFMLGKALSRRGLAYPRRQHFQVDQIVEFDRGVRHECSLPQALSIVMLSREGHCLVIPSGARSGASGT